jgi:hypothetical protein
MPQFAVASLVGSFLPYPDTHLHHLRPLEIVYQDQLTQLSTINSATTTSNTKTTLLLTSQFVNHLFDYNKSLSHLHSLIRYVCKSRQNESPKLTQPWPRCFNAKRTEIFPRSRRYIAHIDTTTRDIHHHKTTHDPHQTCQNKKGKTSTYQEHFAAPCPFQPHSPRTLQAHLAPYEHPLRC